MADTPYSDVVHTRPQALQGSRAWLHRLVPRSTPPVRAGHQARIHVLHAVWPERDEERPRAAEPIPWRLHPSWPQPLPPDDFPPDDLPPAA